MITIFIILEMILKTLKKNQFFNSCSIVMKILGQAQIITNIIITNKAINYLFFKFDPSLEIIINIILYK